MLEKVEHENGYLSFAANAVKNHKQEEKYEKEKN